MNIALVTGGSRGIGRAICVRLATAGCHVLINYNSSPEEAEMTLRMVREAGGEGTLLKFDVSDQAQVESALGTWMAANEGNYISILVNNAGIRKDALLMWMKNEEWQDVLNTNLNSFLYVTRFLVKDMLLKRFGRIVNVVSL
jgi:3-oxoacyl-[acyl-carrier protein] reductase